MHLTHQGCFMFICIFSSFLLNFTSTRNVTQSLQTTDGVCAVALCSLKEKFESDGLLILQCEKNLIGHCQGPKSLSYRLPTVIFTTD